MFEASVDGEAYDAERWGQYYKPYGLTVQTPSAPADEIEFVKPTPPVVDTPWVEPVVDTPVAAPATPASDNRAADILAMIRSRQTQ
jgi:hypothetical protein